MLWANNLTIYNPHFILPDIIESIISIDIGNDSLIQLYGKMIWANHIDKIVCSIFENGIITWRRIIAVLALCFKLSVEFRHDHNQLLKLEEAEIEASRRGTTVGGRVV